MTDPSPVLLTGAAGRLGAVLRPLLSRTTDVLAQTRSGAGETVAADLSDGGDISRLLSMPFGRAVCAAAVSSPAACAADPRGAFRVNSLWPLRLARECRMRGARLVHLSTDLVHSGGTPPYAERSPAVPSSWYGWTKLLGERLVLAALPGALVARTSVLFGEVGAARPTFSEALLSGGVPAVFVDCFRNHTPVGWAASSVCELLDGDASGVLVLTARYAQSRAAFAEMLLTRVGRDPGVLRGGYAPPGVPRDLTMSPERAASLLTGGCPGITASLEMEYPPGEGRPGPAGHSGSSPA